MGHACRGEGTPAPLSLNYQNQSDMVCGLLPQVLSLPHSFLGGLHPEQGLEVAQLQCCCSGSTLTISLVLFENGTTFAHS